MRITSTRSLTTGAALAALLLAGACSNSNANGADNSEREDAVNATGPTNDVTATAGDDEDADATARLVDPSGAEVGSVSFDEEDGATEVEVEVQGLPAGWHGFHIHTIGACEPNSADPADPTKTGDFLSAGGHVGSDAGAHPEHTGDLPPLHVDDAGEGSMTVHTDAFDAAELMDADGSAVMVHAGPDNLANIPDRYSPTGPDEESQKTGDAGARIACGTVE